MESFDFGTNSESSHGMVTVYFAFPIATFFDSGAGVAINEPGTDIATGAGLTGAGGGGLEVVVDTGADGTDVAPDGMEGTEVTEATEETEGTEAAEGTTRTAGTATGITVSGGAGGRDGATGGE